MSSPSSKRSSSDYFNWPAMWPWNLVPHNLEQPIFSNWSLFNVTSSNSSSPETERRIVEQDSYGRQIGRMMDALGELIAERPDTMTKSSALTALIEMKARIDRIKHETAFERLQRIRDDLEALKREDPAEFKRQSAALRDILRDHKT